MGQRGTNTPPVQRRANLRNSREKLEGLLAANFREGAQLVTLTYGEGTKAPTRKLADLQVRDWLRAVRDKQGQRLRYIRATGWENGGDGCPVHRVVVALHAASVASLAGLWEHGPVTVEAVHGEAMKALAALLMRPALEAERDPVPCGRMWSPSAGLIRPEQKGEKKYELSDAHSGGV